MGALEGGSSGKQEEGSPQGSSVVGGDKACVSQPTPGRTGGQIRRRAFLVK